MTTVNIRLGRYVLAIIGLLVGALPGHAAERPLATVLWYAEQERGGEPYRARYIVSDAFVRVDDGNDTGGFALLDRERRRIYNVVPETDSVLTMDGTGAAPEAPEGLGVEVRESHDEDAPLLQGRRAVTLELRAAGELCESAVVAPGLLTDVSAAFAEFYQVLAVQQIRTLENTPAEFRTPCFLARYLYGGDFHAAEGLLLLEWSGAEDRRELLDYDEEVAVDPALFVVPAELRPYRIETVDQPQR
jgi:hypothetical protein